MLLTFFNSLQKRLDCYASSKHRRRCAWLWLAVALFLYSIPARAQNTYVVCNGYVEADVSGDGDGLVTVYYAPCGSKKTAITHTSQTSYLTVNVNGNYYTNNQHLKLSGAGMPLPTYPAGYLQNAKTSYTGPNKDTIETIWEPQGPNTYEIIQDIYTVEFPIVGSGQVVYRFSVKDLENEPVSAQAQFLLDVDLGTPVGNNIVENDAAPITTRYGYLTSQVTSYPNANTLYVPPYFIATLQPVDSGNFPLLMAEGYTNDSLAPEPMGLTQPSLVAYVNWPDVVADSGYTWGFPDIDISDDEALLFQWPSGGADSGQTSVLASFSYGSAACTPICLGGLDAVMIHPEHIVWNGGQYIPNHFPVDGIVWNANPQNATTASGTQAITNSVTDLANGPVKIVSPLPPTNGYMQTHSISSSGAAPGTISEGSASISWEDTVLASVLTNCSTDSIYNIAFSVAAGAVGNTACFAGTYVCPVEVDCENKDVTPPRHSPNICVAGHTTSCGFCKSYKIDSVYDDLASDQGIKSITWSVTPNPTSITVTGVPAIITGCPPSVGPITITQVDTIHAPCVTFTFTDCAGNVSDTTICFERCLPPIPFDTLPPHFRLMSRYDQNFTDTTNIPCEFQCSEWVVTDSVEESLPGLQRDGGLDSIIVVNASNMSFKLVHPVTPGVKEDTFAVCVIDSLEDGSIIIRAVDSADNTSMDTITYCTVADKTPPDLIVGLLLSGSWPVGVSDSQAWDRGVDSVLLTKVDNCKPVPNPSITINTINDSTYSIYPLSPCTHAFNFNIQILDTFAIACFTSQAWDCAGNSNLSAQNCSNGKADLFCPTDTVTEISPAEIMVVFSDYHVINGIPINYDVGLDSIWITNVNNMSMIHHGKTISPLTVGTAIHEPDTSPVPAIYPIRDTVFFYVTDTSLHSNIPDSVCWDAADGSKANPNTGGPNYLCASIECWDTVFAQDSTPPIVTVTYDPCDSLAVTVTDTRKLDQGIYKVWLDTSALTVNLQPFSLTEPAPGVGLLSFNLPILNRDMSASGHLSALDEYGEQSTDTTDRVRHTTSLDMAVYRQNMAMIASGIVNTTSNAGVTFNVPVYLTPTDTGASATLFPLSRKNITQFQFQFHITGSTLLNFVGTKVPPTMPAGWTITPIPGNGPGAGPPYTISGQGPALTDPNMTDTLVYLVFTGARSPDVEEAQIVIDTNDCGDAVSYNGGNDTTISGPSPVMTNYTVTVPAPAGLLNGGTVVFMDSCATIVGNNPHPTILSIAPAIPNPFTGSTLVQYTVPNEATVKLELYNALGQKVRTLVTQDQKQGTYQIVVDGSDDREAPLQSGSYFLRLESSGQICSQRIILSR